MRLGRSRVKRCARIGPFVHQTRIDRAHHESKPGDDVFHLLVALIDGHRTIERAESLGQIAKQNALETRDSQALDIALEVARRFEHVSQNRFGAQLEVASPRNLLAILREGGIEQILERLGVGDLGDALHALIVIDAVHLHFGHSLIARLAFLRAQHLARVFERRFNHGNRIERIGFAFGIKQLKRREQKRRKRLVKREIVGQVHREHVFGAAIFGLAALYHVGIDERGEHFIGALRELDFFLRRLHGVVDERFDASTCVAALLNHGKHHGMGDAQTRRELFGLRFNEVVEGLLAPIHEALGRFLLLDTAQLLLVAASLHHGFVVLNFMLGRLGKHAAFAIEARTARTTGDLMELARTKAAHFIAVEFRELRENHSMDGHVDAHA